METQIEIEIKTNSRRIERYSISEGSDFSHQFAQLALKISKQVFNRSLALAHLCVRFHN